VVERGEADTLVIVENDLFRRGEEATVGRLLDRPAHVLVIDHLMTPTVERADVVLPASTFAEGDGTLVNSEGRAQRAFQVFVPAGDVQESWRWLRDLSRAAGRPDVLSWASLDEAVDAIATQVPALAGVRDAAPSSTFRVAGLKIAREPRRYSGRAARDANVTVHEPTPPADPDTALTFTMEGFDGQPPAPLIARFWEPGWNSVQSVNFYQTEVGGPLRGGDPGRRLIEPADGTRETPPYFSRIPPAFAPRDGTWFAVPLSNIFGSEELSVLAPGIAERMPRPYVALNAGDLRRAGVADGDAVTIHVGGSVSHRVMARLVTSLPSGVVGVPVGLPSMPWVTLPDIIRITPGEAVRRTR
jgi:NADH-quinone oxidoreductase subunit G